MQALIGTMLLAACFMVRERGPEGRPIGSTEVNMFREKGRLDKKTRKRRALARSGSM